MPSGGCFCDAIRISYTGEPGAHLLCHCTDCRKITGATYSNNIVLPEGQFKLESGSYFPPLPVFRHFPPVSRPSSLSIYHSYPKFQTHPPFNTSRNTQIHQQKSRFRQSSHLPLLR
ncbi:hypothetical protein BCIN_02g01330 [Botrytis cinerea B05.10]|uniref:CENP-V/GFA domain-containing protein n=1 Tax=Botryotinia fuckeliana (strain B05.10) TaxID=332648 RepID=A0A384J8G1_BOTFB|nr:hypothetical protein BCIN_02g01330 [Botrytis cinerea B05.10]ATZ46770.1 hypothetical protein BCIN_02g01330 [Botrytis cinerea B05.10]